MATPARPTSPLASGSSESRPSSVGMSKAVESPSPPARSSSLNRRLVSCGGPEAGELAHGPQAGAVHGGVRPPGVGPLAGPLGPVGSVDRLERAPPTSSRTGPCARGSGRSLPARPRGLPWRHSDFNVKVDPRSATARPESPVSETKSPAARRSGRRAANSAPSSDRSPATRRRRPPRSCARWRAGPACRPGGGEGGQGPPAVDGVVAAAAPGPDASRRSTALVTLAALTCSRSPILPSGEEPRRENESSMSTSYRANVSSRGRKVASAQARKHLLEAHDGGDHGHGGRLSRQPCASHCRGPRRWDRRATDGARAWLDDIEEDRAARVDHLCRRRPQSGLHRPGPGRGLVGPGRRIVGDLVGRVDGRAADGHRHPGHDHVRARGAVGPPAPDPPGCAADGNGSARGPPPG